MTIDSAKTREQISRSWYLLYTKPQKEQLALENLQRQGYEVYLPLIRPRKRRKSGLAVLVEPMFPRYLFLRLSTTTDNWGPIRSTIGVSRMIRFGMWNARIPDDLIETIKVRADQEGICRITTAEFKAGDRVRIDDGPFAGYEGIFQKESGRDRVCLLLDIAGRLARLELSAADIERP